MLNTFRRFVNYPVAIGLFFLFNTGCKKSNPCPDTSIITITANEAQITRGWKLELSVPRNNLYTYNWYGPDGWSVESSGATVLRENLQDANAGLYRMQAYDFKGCLVQQGEIWIGVRDATPSPCINSIANNTFISNIPHIGNFSFNSVMFYNMAPHYLGGDGMYNSNGTGPFMRCTFVAGAKPVPGIYKTSNPYSGYPQYGQVQIIIAGSTNTLGAKAGQDVYVNVVNGETQITMCNLQVAYLLTPLYFSSRITMNY